MKISYLKRDAILEVLDMQIRALERTAAEFEGMKNEACRDDLYSPNCGRSTGLHSVTKTNLIHLREEKTEFYARLGRVCNEPSWERFK